MPYSGIITSRALVQSGILTPWTSDYRPTWTEHWVEGLTTVSENYRSTSPRPILPQRKNVSVCDDYFLGLENKWIGIINC